MPRPARRPAKPRALKASSEVPHEDAIPNRADLRHSLRGAESRARAAARSAEILGHLGDDFDDAPDNFYIAPEDVPEGFEYEWKRVSTYGKTDPAYEANVARKGWEPVPADRHPSYVPQGGTARFIERDGLMLFERPTEICERARQHERNKARRQMQQKEEQLAGAPEGHFPRAGDPGVSAETRNVIRPRVGKTYEHVPLAIPE